MAKTAAEKQRDYRQRLARRMGEILAENAELRAEADRVRAELEDARAEIGRLSNPECPHPSGSVENGICGECGRDVW
jgi:hypothetical protein